MRRQLVALVVVLSLAPVTAARGQSAFEQLEDQVRRSTGGQPAPGQPAPVTPAGQEPGYVGLIADDRQTGGNGVSIVEVVAGGPAAQSGLKAGDMITSIDNQSTRSMQDFAGAVGRGQPGTKLVLQVRRGNETLNFNITLGRRPPPGQRRFDQFGPIPESAATGAPRTGMLGVRIASITPDVQRSMNLPSTTGALVVGVVEGSPAATAGIREGAVIMSINGQRVNNPNDLTDLVTAAGAGHEVTVGVFFEGATAERKVTLGEAAPALPASESPPTMALPPAPGGAIPLSSDSRIQVLEQRVEQLEQRVRELEAELKAQPPRVGVPKAPTGPQGT